MVEDVLIVKNFYKNGIFENVNSFLKRIEIGKYIITKMMKTTEEPINEQTYISAAPAAAIDNVNHW